MDYLGLVGDLIRPFFKFLAPKNPALLVMMQQIRADRITSAAQEFDEMGKIM